MGKRKGSEVPAAPSEERGEWRGIYVALLDSPEWQALSAQARSVFLVLKMKLGKSGIGVFYPEALPRLTGFSGPECDAALDELCDGIAMVSGYYRDGGSNHEIDVPDAWVLRDGPLFWIRNGLRFEPGVNLANANHRKGILLHLKTLPKSPLLRAFSRYYGIVKDEMSYNERKASGDTIPMVSGNLRDNGNGNGNGYNRPTRLHADAYAGGKDLATWVGDEGPVERFGETSAPARGPWAATLLAMYGPNGTDSTVWRDPNTGNPVPPDARPGLLGLALDRFASEGKKYHAKVFRRFLEGIIGDFMKGESNGSSGNGADELFAHLG